MDCSLDWMGCKCHPRGHRDSPVFSDMEPHGEYKDFILRNTQYPLLWIGLQATPPDWKWTWVDGSPLDDKLLKDLAPAQENSCGRLNGNKTISETCTTVARWVCEKKALQITTRTRGH
ncbi:Hypothetical predicted protein [Podarcis lilfordi]|uniref:C-type lectin domain-containing protein n=1 Tax=Podarcis lilfordi TaxID=74358 RepID=A0AA35P190_9SAUR|nr:Hypothetical predicted protein [Podarcis lilfordi]